MYSTIEKKKCKCGCNMWPSMGYKGYFSTHAPQEVKDAVGTRKMVSDRRKANRNNLSRKLHLEQVLANPDGSQLQKWFDYVATVIKANPHCWNCGEFINQNDYRNSSAHIFAKSIFESIKTHPLNFLVLGNRCGCHHEWDDSIEKAVKMRVWDMAVARFRSFEDKITEKHKYLNLFKENI